MGKRKSAYINSDSSSGSEGSQDIDKELLALTRKKGVKVEKKIKMELSSSEGDSDDDWGGKSKGNKGKKKAAKRASRSASGTTHSSLSDKDEESDGIEREREGPMSSELVSSSQDIKIKTESDLEEGELSDDDMDQEEFFDGYDEDMMGDAEDRKRLDAMTEKEREQEIFRRIEKRDLLKNRFEAEKKLRMKKKLEARMAKKGGKKLEDLINMDDVEAFSVDAKVRSQERKKTVEGKVDKKTQAMDALKASRDAKKQRAEEKEKIKMEQKERRRDGDDDDYDYKDGEVTSTVAEKKLQKMKLRAADVYSSGSEDEDEPKGRDRNRSGSDSDSRSSDSEDDERSRKPQLVDNLEHLNRIRLSRFKLEKWLYLPIFEKTVIGCYVRLGVAQGSHRLAYKIYEVVGVDEQQPGKVYQLGNVKTNKVLLLRLPGDKVDNDGGPDAKAGKKFRMEFVSNQPFTELEFNAWKERMEFHQVQFPTIADVEAKERDMKSAIEYQLSDGDIEKIIEEKSKLKIGPVNYAAKKTQLMKDREIAVSLGDHEEANRLKGLIQELDEKATQLDKARCSTIASISYINERNRKRNVEEAEKAILEELKVNKGKIVEDPFTRRTTKPRIVSKPVAILNGSEIKASENGEDVKPFIEDAAKLVNLTIEDTTGSLSLDIKPNNIDELDSKNGNVQVSDLFSAHDFDIKLDLDVPAPPVNLAPVARPSLTSLRDTAPRRSLNLEEYKRKKGLI